MRKNTAKTCRPYFTLLVMWPDTNHWSIEFGDYDKACVAQEARDTKDSYRGVKTHIIETDSDVASLNAVVHDMNFELRGEEQRDAD